VTLLTPIFTCPKCLAPLMFTAPYDHAREQETADLRAQLAQQAEALAKAERENALWLSLMKFMSDDHDNGCITAEQDDAFCYVERIGRPDVSGSGETFTEAAIDLATKLGLLPKEESTR
jgi:hypothetical protein